MVLAGIGVALPGIILYIQQGQLGLRWVGGFTTDLWEWLQTADINFILHFCTGAISFGGFLVLVAFNLHTELMRILLWEFVAYF